VKQDNLKNKKNGKGHVGYEKGEVETKQHFLLYCEDNHNRKGANLEKSNWGLTFEEGQ
jgi:hypothetical protein